MVFAIIGGKTFCFTVSDKAYVNVSFEVLELEATEFSFGSFNYDVFRDIII